MQFNLSFTWSYDPLGIISRLRVETKSTPYFYTHRREIEKYKNQPEWVENTLQEADEQHVSSSIVQSPTMQEKTSKRSREEESPLGTDIFSERFKIMYRKKAKLSSRLSLSKDSEQQTIITTNEPLVSSIVGDQSTQSPTTSTTSQE